MRLRTVIASVTLVLAAASVAIAQERPDDTNNAQAGHDPVVIAGADRYETAAKVAIQSYPASSTEVLYIANGETLVDAIAVGVTTDSPSKMLLVRRDEVPQPTLDALDQFKVCKIVFLGGDEAISPAVRDRIVEASTSYC